MSKSTDSNVVIQFYKNLQQQPDLAGCAAAFKIAVSDFGIDTFACGELDITNKDLATFYIVEWPRAWRDFYFISGMLQRDPILEALRSGIRPFTWTELRASPSLSAEGRKALHLAADYGWKDGLVIPVSRSGPHWGLISLVGRDPDLSATSRDVLELMSECLLTRARSLGPTADYPVAPAGLSRREMQTLRLVAQGLTDAEIAAELGISKITAHRHAESARKRMRAKSRANMAARGVALGIV